MAKRYHQSKKDRMHESRGMKRYERINHGEDKFNDEHRRDRDYLPNGMYDTHVTSAEMYMGMDPRRRGELEKDYMIHEDHDAIANLPQNVMIKAYPKTGPYMPEAINDTIQGVDGQMDYDDEQRAHHFYPKKY